MPIEIDYSALPPYMRAPVRGYIEYGHRLGGFLTAVFSNNLVESYTRSDVDNREAIESYVLVIQGGDPTTTRIVMDGEGYAVASQLVDALNYRFGWMGPLSLLGARVHGEIDEVADVIAKEIKEIEVRNGQTTP